MENYLQLQLPEKATALRLLLLWTGCPAGLSLTESDIQSDIDRQKTGKSRFTSQRRESDQVKILSGVFEGITTGTPIGLLIENTDQRPCHYSQIKDLFRPGHGDYTYFKKYGFRDYRMGRTSARETVMRVAAGAIAKKYLRERINLTIQGYTAALGAIRAEQIDLSIVEKILFSFPTRIKSPVWNNSS